MSRVLAALRRDDRGQASEYAMLLALVAAGLLVALLLFGTSVGQSYGRVAKRLDGSTGTQETGAMPAGGTGAGTSAPGQPSDGGLNAGDGSDHDAKDADCPSAHGREAGGGCDGGKDR